MRTSTELWNTLMIKAIVFGMNWEKKVTNENVNGLVGTKATGENVNCDMVRSFIKLFLEMQNEELIQKIESDIDEMIYHFVLEFILR